MEGQSPSIHTYAGGHGCSLGSIQCTTAEECCVNQASTFEYALLIVYFMYVHMMFISCTMYVCA